MFRANSLSKLHRKFFSSKNIKNNSDAISKLFLAALEKLNNDKIFNEQIKPKVDAAMKEKTSQLENVYNLTRDTALNFTYKATKADLSDDIRHEDKPAPSLYAGNWDEVFEIKKRFTGYDHLSYPENPKYLPLTEDKE